MPAHRIEIHPGASDDYLDSLDWYLDRSLEVARRFQAELAQTLDRIAARPEVVAADEDGIRWTRMDRFPHVVYYRVKDERLIEVLAVAHGRRQPGYWRDRLA